MEAPSGQADGGPGGTDTVRLRPAFCMVGGKIISSLYCFQRRSCCGPVYRTVAAIEYVLVENTVDLCYSVKK